VSASPTVAWRFILIVTVTAALSYRPLSAAVEHPSTQHLWVIAAWAILIALGQHQRKANERPIHDRQTDGIIAAGLLGITGIIYWTVAPRLGIDAPQFWIEVPLLILFAMGWSVALFGTRPVFRHLRAWLFALFFGWPLAYRIIIDIAASFGASELFALIGIAAIASAATVGRPARHAFFAGVFTVILGIVGALTFMSPSPTRDLAFAAIAPALACLPWLAGSLREANRSRGTRSLVVRRARLAEGLAITLAAVFLTGLGSMQDPTIFRLGGPLLQTAIDPSPAGWELLARVDVANATTIFGSDAKWTRTYWRADETNREAHDRDGIPRRIVIDDARVSEADRLALLPFSAQYQLTAWTRSSVVALDTGVPFRVVLMAATLERETDVSLAAAFVSVDLPIADGSGQRLNIVAVDDHRATAPFPGPGRGFRTDAWSTVQRLLRGDEAMSLELERVKDAELLESVITGLLLPPGRPSE
jgi:hypothetical protein